MAKQDIHTEEVSAHIAKLAQPFAALVQKTREYILATDPEIGEQIKWNSPSFFFTGEMKAFDPKEYKRDMVVMNLRKGEILLIFPTGARIADDSGFLEGTYTDGRRMAKIRTLEELEMRRPDLQAVIKHWLGSVEK